MMPPQHNRKQYFKDNFNEKNSVLNIFIILAGRRKGHYIKYFQAETYQSIKYNSDLYLTTVKNIRPLSFKQRSTLSKSPRNRSFTVGIYGTCGATFRDASINDTNPIF